MTGAEREARVAEIVDEVAEQKRLTAESRKQRQREASRRYRQGNLDHVRNGDLRRKWKTIESVREKQREAMRQRRAADPEGEAEKLRRWRQANPEKVLARKRAHYHRNKDKYTEHRYRRAYSMTTAEISALLVSQGGVCAICGGSDPGKKGWAVDHCHQTGKVRGILCSKHNLGLGHFADDPALLRAAADYLEKHQ